MKQRKWTRSALLAGMLIVPTLAMYGCVRVPLLQDKATVLVPHGVLRIAIGGMNPKLRTQATAANIERLEITVSSAVGDSKVQTFDRSQMLNGTAYASFEQLPEGMVSVTIKAFDVASVEIGSTEAAAIIKAGQSTTLELTVQLAPTYIVPSDSLAISIKILDGPVIRVPATSSQNETTDQNVRFIAAQNGGVIYLWDLELQTFYPIKGASSGLDDVLFARSFELSRVLFQASEYIYYYDIYSEERVTVAYDARVASSGGAHPVATDRGASITYINQEGLVIQKLREGDFFTKTRILTKISANLGLVEDIDVSDDDKWLAVSAAGHAYLYDVSTGELLSMDLNKNPTVSAVFHGIAPVIQEVAISSDGRIISFTASTSTGSPSGVQLFTLDRSTNEISNVPLSRPTDASASFSITSPYINGGSLYFVISEGGDGSLWKHDLGSSVSRAISSLKDSNVLASDVVI